jgi:SAM-dependent methyltransferase
MDKYSQVSQAVGRLYDAYPFPPDPLTDAPPPGYNWRWSWQAAYSFCTGMKPNNSQIRILDAGCGTGSGTDYLVHLNPDAQVVAMDLSAGTLQVAKERCQRSGATGVEFHNLSIYDVGKLEGKFDFINCVGVLHHLPDPIKGIQDLAVKLEAGGLLHIFVYAELGRWEISLMQRAIALLQGEKRGDYQDGVKVGRDIFANLPAHNRLAQYEQAKWSLENRRDECFADMYVHPQEIDYNVETLFQLIDASGLEFLGFSNPQYWDLGRLLGNSPELMARANQLSDRQRYRLIELLDPEISHYEFFLGRPPIPKQDWQEDGELLQAIPEISPCLDGWPGETIFDFEYKVVKLLPAEMSFLQAIDGEKTVAEILQELSGDSSVDLSVVRSLRQRQIILLAADSI